MLNIDMEHLTYEEHCDQREVITTITPRQYSVKELSLLHINKFKLRNLICLSRKHITKLFNGVPR